MRALKAQGNGTAEIKEVPIPTLRPDYVNVKTVAVALNPTDWKHIGFVQSEATVGCDFAGIVEKVGSDVQKPLKKGDKVCGFVHGTNVVHGEDGAFGDYLTAKGDLLMKVPDNMGLEDASTLGVGIITCGQGLYQEMNLPWPESPEASKKNGWILIYGGSSATGMHGIQYAKLSGFDVITTCSPRNFELVKSLGASHAFDYKSPTCAEDIRKLTENKLLYAWDTISEGDSPKICCDALSNNSNIGKPKYGSILPVKLPREDVDQTYSLGYTAMGEAFTFVRRREYPAKPDHFEFAKKWTAFSEKLLAEGKIKPHKKEVREGGLDKILEGCQDLKEGRVSGTKLVYQIG